MAVELKVKEGVTLVRVGTYSLSSGEHTFTEEALKAAADAYVTDPAVKAPRAKIASVEAALGLDPTEHGGEPAFGVFQNLRVSENGQELLADFYGPKAVVDAMEWSYPSLSVEAGPMQSATGRTHDLVITAVALLGVHWPGVTTIEDFTEFMAEGPKIEKTAGVESEVVAVIQARATPIAASLDQDMVVRRLYDALDGGDVDLPEGTKTYDMWVRSVRFDDAGKPYAKVTDEGSGKLYRVDFKVSGAEVTFGKLVEVVEQDVPVAASMIVPPAPLKVWATRADSRALASQPNMEASGMTPEQVKLLAPKLGLDPDTATEEDVLAAAAAPDPEPVTPDPEKPTTPEIPDGFSLVDDETLTHLRQGADAGLALAATARKQTRQEKINAAINAGKFPPSRREHFETLHEADPDGTDALIAKLAPGLVPVDESELGAGGEGEGAGADDGSGTGWFTNDAPVEA